ncbi:MAG TPA: hypothetical protein PLB62_06815 [Candidatus Sumerlaeota bacterium]|nr:hypothetical protein [Candidatus Sumerlaeota bacterium]
MNGKKIQDDFSDTLLALRICLYCILGLAWIFSVKSCSDSRSGMEYRERITIVNEKMARTESLHDKEELINERDAIMKGMIKKYRFPRLFFFFFLFVFLCLALWGTKSVTHLPQRSLIRLRSAVRMILALAVMMFAILFFFLFQYHKITSFFWTYFFLLFQWALIAFAGFLGSHDNTLEHVMGLKPDKNLIDGPPPPAW